MKRLLFVFVLVGLPFLNGVGGLYAISFELQVPMQGGVYATSNARSEAVGNGGMPVAAFRSTSTCNTATTAYSASSFMTAGKYTSTVQPLDETGCATAPGATKPHIRKVSHDDDEDDPFLPSEVDPLGETPWGMIIVLLLGFMLLRGRHRIADAVIT